MTASVLWLRRDLRLRDHPALIAAAEAGPVALVFVRDPALRGRAGRRVARLEASLADLAERTGGALVVRTGDPAVVVPQLAEEVGAGEVHVTGETTPYGRRRDARVGRALGSRGRALVPHGTPYAVSPGRVRTAAGAPYQVFTPFSRAWRAHGWPAPAPEVETRWVHGVLGEPLPTAAAFDSGPVGEDAALRRWEEFRDHDLAQYAEARDRPDLDATSRLSVPLKYGEIHPRTLLADLAASPPAGEHADASVDRFVAELCWREFYADVLWHRPDAAWRDLRTDLAALAYDSGPEVDALVESWRRGSTGFPLVDAGMRHLLAEGWMPNRVRMVAASFLVKDLHVWWPVGARHFLDHLLDGDLASNSGGWQWTAGTGTDAAPYFRVFNPVSQGLRFDPHGDYVRRWVPELRHLPGPAAHRPWEHPEGLSRGYPPPAVDHAAERADALARYRVAGLGPREASGRGSSG